MSRPERQPPVVVLLAVPLLLASCESEDPQEDAGPSDNPARTALIVAISDYPADVSDRFEDLPGARNDVDLICKNLIERFGFPKSEIRVLRDDEATHENIVREFDRWLIQRATEDTEALFWYSGHGSRVPDQSGRYSAEHEGMDSTLVAWDSRTGGRRGEYDVSDDELASLLVALTQKTGRVTVVTDSCHSGGVVRSAATRVARFLPDGTAPQDFELVRSFWPEGVELFDDQERPLDPSRFVHISACGPDQIAREIPARRGDGTYKYGPYGALTYYLVERLAAAEPGETYRQIAEHVERRIANHVKQQTVQIDGAVERQLFEGRFASRPAGYKAYADPAVPRVIRIEAGELHGLRVGSRLRMFSNLGEELGHVAVTRVESVSAVGSWQGQRPPGLAESALLAREESRPAGHPPLLLEVPAADLAALVTEACAEEVRIVAGDPDVCELDWMPSGAAAVSAKGIALRDRDGADLLRVDIVPGADTERDDAVRAAIREVVGTEQKYLSLLDLAEMPGALRLDVTVAPLEEEDLDVSRGWDAGRGERWKWKGVELYDAGVQPLRGGLWQTASSPTFLADLSDAPTGKYPLARLDVRNSDIANPTDVYFSVLCVKEDRSIAVLWPRREDGKDMLAAGESRRIPLFLDPEPTPGFDRPVSERLLVIATRAPADFWPLAQGETYRSTGAIPPLIENALSGQVLRGGSSVSVESSADYGVTDVRLVVKPRATGAGR